MAQPVQPGRVDRLANGVFKKLVDRYANPHIRLACRLFEKEIGECFEEELGPGTKAHEVGNRIAHAIERRFD
jgi:hypothetical protein